MSIPERELWTGLAPNGKSADERQIGAPAEHTDPASTLPECGPATLANSFGDAVAPAHRETGQVLPFLRPSLKGLDGLPDKLKIEPMRADIASVEQAFDEAGSSELAKAASIIPDRLSDADPDIAASRLAGAVPGRSFSDGSPENSKALRQARRGRTDRQGASVLLRPGERWKRRLPRAAW